MSQCNDDWSETGLGKTLKDTVNLVLDLALGKVHGNFRERVLDLARETCPNCESAYTGGHPDPDNRAWCVLCSDPQTGEMRGWIWKWTWVNQLFTTRRNFALIDLAHRLELVQRADRSSQRR